MKKTLIGPRSLLCAAVLLCFGLAAPVASAERYPPAPQAEDIAFLQLGSVAEMVTTELYWEAEDSTAFVRPERNQFGRLARKRERAWERLNRLLGEDAITEEDFAVRIPNSVLRSRQETLALAARFERLLAGLYLSGTQSTIDPPTRLLIGRHLAAATQNLTVLRGMRGSRLNLKAPKPLSVQYVGTQFDRYLALPDPDA